MKIWNKELIIAHKEKQHYRTSTTVWSWNFGIRSGSLSRHLQHSYFTSILIKIARKQYLSLQFSVRNFHFFTLLCQLEMKQISKWLTRSNVNIFILRRSTSDALISTCSKLSFDQKFEILIFQYHTVSLCFCSLNNFLSISSSSFSYNYETK